VNSISKVQLGTRTWAHVRIGHRNWHCAVCPT